MATEWHLGDRREVPDPTPARIPVDATELAEFGITANSVAPGEIATPMNGQTEQDPTTIDRPGVPLGASPGTPERFLPSSRSWPRRRDAASGTGGRFAHHWACLEKLLNERAGAHQDTLRRPARGVCGRDRLAPTIVQIVSGQLGWSVSDPHDPGA